MQSGSLPPLCVPSDILSILWSSQTVYPKRCTSLLSPADVHKKGINDVALFRDNTKFFSAGRSPCKCPNKVLLPDTPPVTFTLPAENSLLSFPHHTTGNDAHVYLWDTLSNKVLNRLHVNGYYAMSTGVVPPHDRANDTHEECQQCNILQLAQHNSTSLCTASPPQTRLT